MEKYDLLIQNLKKLGSAAVAFSGGVDSTLLLKAAHEALEEKCAALTASSVLLPKRELESCIEFCRRENIAHYIIDIDVFGIDGFAENPPDRCYICKKHIFAQLRRKADGLGIENLIEGSNADDTNDHRPGMKAIEEDGVLSPLRDAGMTKADIRSTAKRLGLTAWNKPALACLASRFAHGERITPEGLENTDKAEAFLLGLGIEQVRFRTHGDIARIEVSPEGFETVIKNRSEIECRLKGLGYRYITLDLGGYRTGSMNYVQGGKI